MCGMRWSARSKATLSLRTFNCLRRPRALSGESLPMTRYSAPYCERRSRSIARNTSESSSTLNNMGLPIDHLSSCLRAKSDYDYALQRCHATTSPDYSFAEASWRRQRSLLNVDGLAVFQNQKRFWLRSSQQLPLGCVDAIIGKLKCAVVDRDTRPRTQDFMRSHCFVWIHMDRRHEPSRLIGSDWQESEPRRSKPLADLAEMIAESCVPREINLTVLAHDHVSAPESSVAIREASARKMLCWNTVNRSPGQLLRFAPIE